MLNKIQLLFAENTDIRLFFEEALKEKYILPHILSYVTNYTHEYREWRENLPKETFAEMLVRQNKIGVHAAKYNKKNIQNRIGKYYEYSYSDYFKFNCRFIPNFTDILHCISFRKYKPGAIFNIEINGQNVTTIRLTKENRYNMFIPINHRLPIFQCCIHSNIVIRSDNVTLNKPIYFYGSQLSTEDKNKLLNESNDGIILPYDNNGFVLKYFNDSTSIQYKKIKN